MEVVPIEIIKQTEVSVEQFRIRKTRPKSKRLDQLKKAYHPQDEALIHLHEPNLLKSVDLTSGTKEPLKQRKVNI
jgi:hypothetical protein